MAKTILDLAASANLLRLKMNRCVAQDIIARYWAQKSKYDVDRRAWVAMRRREIYIYINPYESGGGRDSHETKEMSLGEL